MTANNKNSVKNPVLRDLDEKFIVPGSSIFFSGINQIKNYYKDKLNVKDIKEFLQQNNAYNLHTEYRRRKDHFAPTFAYAPKHALQADLLQVDNYAKSNDGVKYILAVIDAFSRKAYIYPLKSKQTDEVLSAFKHLFNTQIAPIRTGASLCTDEGGEFTSKKFQTFLKDNKIKHKIGRALGHCGIIERFLRSFSRLLRQYMTHNDTKRYLDQIYNILDTYNSRVSTIITVRILSFHTKDKFELDFCRYIV